MLPEVKAQGATGDRAFTVRGQGRARTGRADRRVLCMLARVKDVSIVARRGGFDPPRESEIPTGSPKRHYHRREVKMFARVLGTLFLALGFLAPLAQASPQQDLDSAAKQKKVAFVLVTDLGAAGVDAARDMIQQAMRQVKQSTLVELDRSSPGNADLVAKFRLAGAPVPLILVTATTGMLAGGVAAAQATAEQLVGMVPSPKKAEALEAIQNGKAVLISASRKGMALQSGAKAACATACGQLADKCVTVQIDMDDPQEAGFLAAMKVNLASTEPVILVINAQGQVTGTYAGAVDVATLVQATTKKAGGCAPGACGPGAKACGPAK